MRIKSLLAHAPDQELELSFSHYQNGRLAIQATSLEGEPIARLTCDIPSIPLAPGEIIIKNWSENQGTLETLLAADLIHEPREIRVGWAKGYITQWKGPTK